MPKRGERVTPPVRSGTWDVRYGPKHTVDGWEELCRAFPAATWEAWIILTERPTTPENHRRQHLLKGKLGTHVIGNKTLDQWQYEVTSAARIWYCPDSVRRIVWLTLASTGHPKATE